MIHVLLCVLLCCTAFLVSCGPTQPTPTTVLASPAAPVSAVFRKATEGGEPRWFIDLTWTPPPLMYLPPATSWGVRFYERQVASAPPSDFTWVDSLMGQTVRQEQKGTFHTHPIPMDETWWGTTRDFHARIRITGRAGSREGAVPIPATLTFPPMPPEFVLLKMQGKMDAICHTFLHDLTQPACIRQRHRWDSGVCIKNTTIAEIVPTIAQHPDWTADAILRHHGASDFTSCYSTFHDRNEAECLQRQGTWTTWHPAGEELFYPVCSTELQLSEVLDVFLYEDGAPQ